MVEGEEQPLVPGMCFSIEPGIYLPRALRRADRGHRRPSPRTAGAASTTPATSCRSCISLSPASAPADPSAALQSLAAELDQLLPADAIVVDAHTHLGRDEDGQSQTPEQLLEFLDQVRPDARACTFPFHDPERSPAYRLPNDRVLRWAQESEGRLYPYCRLDPGEDPVAEAERCLALGARGIKLHPRAQAFGFGNAAAESIWKIADEARVPILIHAGRGMPRDGPARRPRAALSRRRAGTRPRRDRRPGHVRLAAARPPRRSSTTPRRSRVFDQLELFARVPAERIVFASDVPYGRPISALHIILLMAALRRPRRRRARTKLIGGTMLDVLEGRPLADPKPPRVPEIRLVSGRLARLNGYLMMAFAAAIGSGPPPNFERSLQFINLARSVVPRPRSRRGRADAGADRRNAGRRPDADRGGRRADARGDRAGRRRGCDRRHPAAVARALTATFRLVPSTDRLMPPAGWRSRRILLRRPPDRDLQPMCSAAIFAILSV